jgi:hypothetical protein
MQEMVIYSSNFLPQKELISGPISMGVPFDNRARLLLETIDRIRYRDNPDISI